MTGCKGKQRSGVETYKKSEEGGRKKIGKLMRKIQ